MPNLERDQQRDGLERIITAVDVVAHKEVVGVGAGTADSEELLEVVVLAVDVAADCYGALDLGGGGGGGGS